MFTISCASACVRVGTLLATIAVVTCDYEICIHPSDEISNKQPELDIEKINAENPLFRVTNLEKAWDQMDGNQAASFADRNLDSNVLCNGGRCTETSDGIAGAMWFGPRLGRKRRSDEKMETIDEEIGAIADVINSGPWAWVAYSGGGDKRHTTQFTPRLGRELTDDFLQKYMAYDFDKNRLSRYIAAQEDASLQRHQSPPPPPPQFAPRLGRNLPFNPSPRLGRHLRFVQKV